MNDGIEFARAVKCGIAAGIVLFLMLATFASCLSVVGLLVYILS